MACVQALLALKPDFTQRGRILNKIDREISAIVKCKCNKISFHPIFKSPF